MTYLYFLCILAQDKEGKANLGVFVESPTHVQIWRRGLRSLAAHASLGTAPAIFRCSNFYCHLWINKVLSLLLL